MTAIGLIRAAETQRAPDVRNLRYGPHWRHTIDVFYPAERGTAPLPLVVHIHGGGWRNGDKSAAIESKVAPFNARGIAVASINYRMVTMAREGTPMDPPVAAPLWDAARAVQYLRYHADDLALDPSRVGLTGGSAGAASSLWLALHDDLADPASADPVARQSTRVACAGVLGAQTTLDPQQMREWIGPVLIYGAHAFFHDAPADLAEAFPGFLARREELLPWIKEYSAYYHASADDPPIFLDYGNRPNTPPVDRGHATHHPQFGERLKQRLDELGVECHLTTQDGAPAAYAGAVEFLIAKLAR